MNTRNHPDISTMNAEELEQLLHLYNKKEVLYHALRSFGGLKGILNAAYTYLENPIVVCDTSFSVLASHLANDFDSDFETYNNKHYMKTEAITTILGVGLADKIFSSHHPFVMPHDQTQIPIMYYRITILKNVIGYICVPSNNRAFTEEDYETVEILSQVLSIEMQKDNFFSGKSGLKHEYFLTDLIKGNMTDRSFIEQRMVQLGHSPKSYYWIMEISFLGKKKLPIGQNYYLEQILAILKSCFVFSYKENFVILCTADSRIPFSKSESLKLTDFLTRNQMHLAVSYAFTDITEAPVYYRQAEQLVTLLHTTNIHPLVLKYEDYIVECLASGLSGSAEHKALIHPDLFYLRQYDLNHNTEYMKTLKTFLKCQRNAVKSAETLHIHKSTFFYRIGKIEDLLHIDITDCEKLYQYEVSLRVLNLF